MYASTFALALLVASFRGASAAADRPACVNFNPVGKILLGSGFAHAPFRVDLSDRLQAIAQLCRAPRDGRVQERCGMAFSKATAAVEGLGARVANPEAVVGGEAVLLELGRGLDQGAVVANLSGTFGHSELSELIKAGAKASRGRRVRVTSVGLVAERRAVAGSAAGANRVGDLGGEQQLVKVKPESLALEAESLAGELGDLAAALKERRFPFAADNPEVLESLRQLLRALAGRKQRFAHPPAFLAEGAEVSYRLGRDGALDVVGHLAVAPDGEDLTIYPDQAPCKGTHPRDEDDQGKSASQE